MGRRDHSEGWCTHCHCQVVTRRDRRRHWLHLLLTILTAGLWGFVWFYRTMRPVRWRCTECGHITSPYK